MDFNDKNAYPYDEDDISGWTNNDEENEFDCMASKKKCTVKCLQDFFYFTKSSQNMLKDEFKCLKRKVQLIIDPLKDSDQIQITDKQELWKLLDYFENISNYQAFIVPVQYDFSHIDNLERINYDIYVRCKNDMKRTTKTVFDFFKFLLKICLNLDTLWKKIDVLEKKIFAENVITTFILDLKFLLSELRKWYEKKDCLIFNNLGTIIPDLVYFGFLESSLTINEQLIYHGIYYFNKDFTEQEEKEINRLFNLKIDETFILKKRGKIATRLLLDNNPFLKTYTLFKFVETKGASYGHISKPLKEIQNELKINMSKRDNFEQIPTSNPKIISIYSEKGGVGKTTICLNLAFTFAAMGKRVLIYDCDGNRNATAWAFGNNINVDHDSSLDNFVKKIEDNKNGYPYSLFDQINYSDDELKRANALMIRENLYMVIGNNNTCFLDHKIGINENITSHKYGGLLGYLPNNVSARPYYAIMKTAQHYKIDYVLLDLNSYPGSLNRCLVMSSHYLIIPCCLDVYNKQSLNNMLNNFEKWHHYIETEIKPCSLRNENKKFPWPDHTLQLLGYITNKVQQRFRCLTGDFEFEKVSKSNAKTAMIKESLSIEPEDTKEFDICDELKKLHIKSSCTPRKIGEIQDFSDLGYLADMFHTPVHFIDEQFLLKGANKELMLMELEKKNFFSQKSCFKFDFRSLAQEIQKLIETEK